MIVWALAYGTLSKSNEIGGDKLHFDPYRRLKIGGMFYRRLLVMLTKVRLINIVKMGIFHHFWVIKI